MSSHICHCHFEIDLGWSQGSSLRARGACPPLQQGAHRAEVYLLEKLKNG